MSAFGSKIREARKLKGLTQAELAKIIGVKGNTISDWEHNKSRPDIDTLELLMGALEIDSSYLFNNKDKEEYIDNINNAVTRHEKTSGILNILETMNDEDMDTVISLIKRLSK